MGLPLSPNLCVLAGLPGHGGGQGRRRGARTPRGCGAHGESPPHPDSPADSRGGEVTDVHRLTLGGPQSRSGSRELGLRLPGAAGRGEVQVTGLRTGRGEFQQGPGPGRWRQGGRGPGTHSVPAWLAQAGGGSVLSGWCPPTEGQVLFPLGTPTPTLQGPGIRPASWGPLPPGGWPPAVCEGRGQADRPGWGGAGQALLLLGLASLC